MRALTRNTQYALAALLLPMLVSCGSSGGGGAATSIAPVTFTAVDHATGDGPRRIAIDDLNGDGALDVVTANAISGDVSVLLGNGDGTLQPREDIPVGPTTFYLAIGDLNGDMIPDLAVTFDELNGPDNVALLFGTGNGDFSPATTFETGDVTSDVFIADFNDDSFSDLAIAGLLDLSVFLGNGDGTFAASFSTDDVGSFTAALASADFDGDGNIDIVSSTVFNNGTISFVIGNGDGTFQPVTTQAICDDCESWDVKASDVNSDGAPDVVLPIDYTSSRDPRDDEIVVMLGKGDGTFSPHIPFVAGRKPNSVAVGDFNNDSLPDIVLGGDRLSVLTGFGTGFFAAERVLEPEADIFQGLAVADMDGDGLPDIVTANYDADLVTVYLQQ